MLQFIWLFSANQSALFQHSMATLKFVSDIGSKSTLLQELRVSMAVTQLVKWSLSSSKICSSSPVWTLPIYQLYWKDTTKKKDAIDCLDLLKKTLFVSRGGSISHKSFSNLVSTYRDYWRQGSNWFRQSVLRFSHVCVACEFAYGFSVRMCQCGFVSWTTTWDENVSWSVVINNF